MKKNIILCLSILVIFIQCTNRSWEKYKFQLQKYYKEKNFFKLDNLMSRVEINKNNPDWLLYKATLDNVFNKPSESENSIDLLFSKFSGNLNDTVIKELYSMRSSNAFHLQKYGDAYKYDSIIVHQYKHVCDSFELDFRNDDISLFRSIAKVPQMNIEKSTDSKVLFKRDIAGLYNVTVALNSDSVDFVFDTGASVSVMIESIAKKYGVKMLPGKVRTGTSTSKKVEGQMGILDFKLGNLKVRNAVFLVLPDSLMTFGKGIYVIKGIIGFPVMYNLNNFIIKEDKYLVIPQNKEESPVKNFALDGQYLVIKVIAQNDTLPFMFDSGNTNTNLSSLYYNTYKKSILGNCKNEKSLLGGAGGIEELESYILDSLHINAGFENYTLRSVRIYQKGMINYDIKKYYGNFGQDFINKFSDMEINFKSMCIKFYHRKSKA